MANSSLKLYYSLVPNALPETEGNHAVVSHVGTVDTETFFERVAKRRPGLDASTAELVMSSVCGTAADILSDRQYRVSLGAVSFELAIPGSTSSIGGAMAGPAYVAVRASASLRNAASDVSPVYSAGDGERTEIFSVECVPTRHKGEIVGTEPFRLAGANLSASGDGESLKVVAADGTEAVAEVAAEAGTGRFITARLSTALPEGKGKVVLKTHGKRTPEGELRALSKSVTILAGPEPTDAPTATSWVADGMEGEPIDLESSSVTVSGTKLAGATKVQFMYSEDGAVFDSADVGEATDTSATAQCGFTGTPTQAEGFLRVVTPNGTTNSIPCTFSR